MKVQLTAVGKGPRFAALPLTTVSFRSGEVTLARAETEQRPTVLGLIASGRMRPDTGAVTIDDAVDYGAMRRRIALIDAPEVSDPASDVTLAGVVSEELMFAGRASHPVAVNRMLQTLGTAEWGRYSIGTVPPMVRIRTLAELAVLRDGVEGLVITSPDRHGGDPNGWWQFTRDLAGRGLAVLVIAGDASAAAIAASTLVDRLGEHGPGSAPSPDLGHPDEDPARGDADRAESVLDGLAPSAREVETIHSGTPRTTTAFPIPAERLATTAEALRASTESLPTTTEPLPMPADSTTTDPTLTDPTPADPTHADPTHPEPTHPDPIHPDPTTAEPPAEIAEEHR